MSEGAPTGRITHHNRLVVMLLAGIGACVMALGTSGFAIFYIPRPGYQFPPVSDVAEMDAELSDFGSSNVRSFRVPTNYYEEILHELSASEPSEGASKWDTLARLKIYTNDGQCRFVVIFHREQDAVCIFSVGPSPDARTCYQGGNSRRVGGLLEKAYSESTAP